MPHSVTLIHTIAAALGLALVLGFLAARLRLPALVGYLLAGVAIGPFTPGFVADAALASQLAEIGVMLLMFGVGLHFSWGDLLAVRKIAVPGAVVQMMVATSLGMALALWWGWGMGGPWCLVWRCRWPARWCCCVRWRPWGFWTATPDALRWGGWWWRTWPWCWCWCCYHRWGDGWEAVPVPTWMLRSSGALWGGRCCRWAGLWR